MALSRETDEFVRRFLLHILPDRFVKIRYYGLMSNRNGKEKLRLGRSLLEGAATDSPDPEPEPWQDLLKRITGIYVRLCRACSLGTMIFKIQLVPYAGGIPP